MRIFSLLLLLKRGDVDERGEGRYATGMQGLFTYGDTGPNKYTGESKAVHIMYILNADSLSTATANGLMFYGQQYGAPRLSPSPKADPTLNSLSSDIPRYTLFQRESHFHPKPNL